MSTKPAETQQQKKGRFAKTGQDAHLDAIPSSGVTSIAPADGNLVPTAAALPRPTARASSAPKVAPAAPLAGDGVKEEGWERREATAAPRASARCVASGRTCFLRLRVGACQFYSKGAGLRYASSQARTASMGARSHLHVVREQPDGTEADGADRDEALESRMDKRGREGGRIRR